MSEASVHATGSADWPALARGLLLVGVLAAAAFTVHQALTVRVFYWDTWEYLSEARRISGEPGGSYRLVHAPLPQLALIPASIAGQRAAGDAAVHWVAPRLTATLWTFALLAVSYGWLRRRMGREAALFGLFAICSTRLFVRYGSHPMVDVPSAVWAVGALWAYEVGCARSAQRGPDGGAVRSWLALGACFAGAILSKYSMAVLPLPFIAVELARSVRGRSLRNPHVAGLLLSGVVGAGFALAVVAAVHLVTLGGFEPLAIYRELRGFTADVWSHERPTDYLVMAVQMVSPLTLLLAGVGLVVVARRRANADLAPCLWLIGYAALISIAIEHNEARYLWPLLPVVAWLGAEGAVAAVTAARRASVPLPLLWSGALATAAFIALPGVDQARRDLDPFYRNQTLAELMRFVDEYAGKDRPIYWEGGVITLTPADPAPIERDELFDFFHVGPQTISHLARRPVMRVEDVRVPALFLARQGGAGNVLLRTPEGWPDATAWRAGKPLPRHFVAFGRKRIRLVASGDTYVERADGRETAWLRWADAAGRLEVRALRDLEALRLYADRGRGAQPLLSVAGAAAGAPLLTPIELGPDRSPPPLVLVFDAERRFEASTAQH